MKIILNRDIRGLGKAGEICVVRDGYGRNFLLPKGYAIIANKANVALMEQKLAELKANNVGAEVNTTFCGSAAQVPF